MRVISQKSVNLLKSIGLDQSNFRLGRTLLNYTEKLENLHQDVIFLKRCKRNGLIPPCVWNAVKPPVSLTKPSTRQTLQKTLDTTRRKILTLLIRTKYADINYTRIQLNNTLATIPEQTLTKLTTIIDITRSDTKRKTKKRLINKYKKLQEHVGQKQAESTKTETTEPKTPTTTNNERVSIIGDIKVPKPALDALSKGPKFVLTSQINQEQLEHALQVEVAALAYHLRWQHTMNSITTNTTTGQQNSPTNTTHNTTHNPSPYTLAQIAPFHNNRLEPPLASNEIERMIQRLQTEMHGITKSYKQAPTKQNMTSRQRKAVLTLRDEEDITITKSDKGGEMVVMKASDLKRLCLDHLNDSNTYEQLSKDPTNTLRVRVNKDLSRILSHRQFPQRLITNLKTPSNAKVQHFYALPKTHKKVLKIRPIVSACGGIFDRLGWLLQTIFKPLLKNVSAHIDSTADLLRRFNDIDKDQLKGKIPVSFDVVSLYTNIDVNEAIDTTLRYAQLHKLNLYGLELTDLLDLLHLLLDNNVFTYNACTYKQIRGLAMGNRLSGTLAIICMDRFERMFIYSLQPPLTIFVRYVDDTGTVVDNVEQANNLLTYLNKQHPTIKFEMDLPDTDGYLPILDVKMHINQHGKPLYKLYSKPAAKGITLNYDSHQPRSIKLATATNEFRRATLCSSVEHRDEAISAIRTKLVNNDFPTHITNITHTPTKKRQQKRQQHTAYRLTFNIPYISDNFNTKIQRLLHKHNIPARLVNRRGTTLRELVRPKANIPTATRCSSKECSASGICQRTSVVYEATCLICKNSYIGLTTRKLHDRAREHSHAATNKLSTSAFGDHYREEHPKQAAQLTFKIICHARDTLRLHIEEAMAIQSLKPRLNRRKEHLGTGFLPS